jgi:hypothetical protein
MVPRDELMKRLGEIRDATERARAERDIAGLTKLTDERDRIREQLEPLLQPSRVELEAELDRTRAHLAGLDYTPVSGMMVGMAGGGGREPAVVSADNVRVARRAQEQDRADSGVDALEGRIASLEEQLRHLAE